MVLECELSSGIQAKEATCCENKLWAGQERYCTCAARVRKIVLYFQMYEGCVINQIIPKQAFLPFPVFICIAVQRLSRIRMDKFFRFSVQHFLSVMSVTRSMPCTVPLFCVKARMKF
jgi:hypothetical protein